MGFPERMTTQHSVLVTFLMLSLVAFAACEDVPKKKLGRDLTKEWNTMKSEEQGRIWGITFIACTAFLIAIVIFNSNLELTKNKAEIMRYEAEIEYVDKMTTEIMVCSLQDQKQGIHYFDNPIMKMAKDSQLKRTERNLTKKKKSMGTALGSGLFGAMGISAGDGLGVNPEMQVTAEIEVETEGAPLVQVEVEVETPVFEVEVEVEIEAPVVEVEVEIEVGVDVDGNAEAPEHD